MKLITVYLPEPFIEALNEAVKQGLVPNRAEAIRDAVRDYLRMYRLLEKVEVSRDMLAKLENIEH